MKKVIAISSAGGHWVELLRLRAAWADCAVSYITTNPEYRDEVLPAPTDKHAGAGPGVASRGPAPRFYSIVNANRWQRLRLAWQLLQIVYYLLRLRPDVVVSTGASPGYFAIRIGGLLGAKTIWIDSIANAEELSMSGQMAGKHADVWITQWQHLAQPATADGPLYFGAVL